MFYRKIVVICATLFMFVSLVKGSCLEYGHSCWGAHGKRSGDNHLKASADFDTNPESLENDEALIDEKLKMKTKIESLGHNGKMENGDNYGDYKKDEKIPIFLKEAIKTHKDNQNKANTQNFMMKNKNRNIRANLIWRKLPLYQYPVIPLKDSNEWLQQLEKRPSPNGMYDDTFYYDGQ